jgi:hypothetical protein
MDAAVHRLHVRGSFTATDRYDDKSLMLMTLLAAGRAWIELRRNGTGLAPANT